MLFPISDDDRHISGPAYITWFLLAANIIVYLYQMQEPAFTYGWSVIPREIVTGEDLVGTAVIRSDQGGVEIPQAPGPTPIYLTILTAMFMHGGLAHIFGNMLYLWIFGDNVEHRFGHAVFLLFYLASGIVATGAQIALAPESVIPNLGASGAIAGVLGAYLVLFPRNRVHAVFIFRVIALPAVVVIGVWIAFQFIGGFGQISDAGETGGVAYGAHIGGFVAGLVLALILRARISDERDSVVSRVASRDTRAYRYW
jgi:membrane associated rhomboid family serine protease